jgi:general L-amino acid transport system substrate-binding protein
MRLRRLLLAVSILVLGVPLARAGTTLDQIREYGALRCGLSGSTPGLSAIGPDGRHLGFFVDFCRALAAATGSPEAVEYVQLNTQTRFDALRAREVDVLVTNTTLTLSRDAGAGIKFAGIYYYDGQGFLAPSDFGPKSLAELHRATICVTTSTTTETNLAELQASGTAQLATVPFRSIDEMFNAFFARRCDLVTDDGMALAAHRVSQAARPQDFIIFPDVVSKEPLGPATRSDDLEWNQIVGWTINALIAAEEKGATAANLEAMHGSKDPELRRLLGFEGNLGKSLGLDAPWAHRIVKEGGNYGEIFERNLGRSTPLGLARGRNALWKDGGLMYAPPFR